MSSPKAGMDTFTRYEFPLPSRLLCESIDGLPMQLDQLLDPALVYASLNQGGLHVQACTRLAERFTRVAKTLNTQGVSPTHQVSAFFVPGRIEVLGKHTDYAGGSSLVCAVERGFCVIGAAHQDPKLHVSAVDLNDSASFKLEPDLLPRTNHWTNYPMTVARRVARNFPGSSKGGHIAFSSDLPRASGMSSSSALVIAFFRILEAFNALDKHPAYHIHFPTREAPAQYLGTVENGQSFGTLAGDKGVGTFGGSQDHTAILCSAPNALRQFAYSPTRFERSVSLPEDYVFVIGYSGVIAQKTGAAQEQYNRAALLAADVASAWNAYSEQQEPHLGAILAGESFSRTRMLEALQSSPHPRFTSADLIDRYEHFYNEYHEILPAAVQALAEGDLGTFGHLVDRSQHGAETLLKNQVDETVFLAQAARKLGAIAASAFGAGFGGSVWALVHVDQAEAFCDAWATTYQETFPEAAQRASFFIDRPGPAAFELSDV